VRLNVDENRRCTNEAYGLGGGDEGKCGGNDFVAGLNPAAEQGQVQCVGAIGAANGVIDAEILGGFLVEGLHVGTENETGFAERLQNSAVDFRFEAFILTLEVDHGYIHIDSLI